MAYKPQRRTGIMLAYPFEERRLITWKPPWIVQPKLDGERARAIVGEAGDISLLSSEGNLITSVPHINKALQDMHLRPGLELDGELYRHQMPIEEIHSRVSRKKDLHPNREEIEYHIFDLVDLTSQMERLKALYQSGLNDFNPPIQVVPFEIAHTFSQVMSLYDSFIEAGYEGFVIRNSLAPYLRKRSVWMMKFKPKKEDMYLIIGYEEEMSIHGERKGRLGALALRNPDVYAPESFSVGTGFSAEQREQMWTVRDSLIGKVAVVKYQHLTEKHVPRFPVFVEIIDPKEAV